MFVLSITDSKPSGSAFPGKPTRPARSGDVVEVDIHALASSGNGVGRLDGMAVFVPRALPGQRVRTRLAKVKKRFAEGVLLEVLTPCPQGTEPFCTHFGLAVGSCGGCDWQHLDYAAQLVWKRQVVVDACARIGGLGDAAEALVEPCRPSPATRHFRNSMQFAFAGKGAGLNLGLRCFGSPGQVLDVTQCGLMNPVAMEMVAFARDACRAGGLPAYDAQSGRGMWRHLVLRANPAGEFQVMALTSPDQIVAQAAQTLLRELRATFPQIIGAVHGIKRGRGGPARPDKLARVYGAPRLPMVVAGREFALSPQAFFQTNCGAAQVLVDAAADMAALSGSEVLYDVYCGVGLFGLALADAASVIVGFELSDEAVNDAAANAEANGVGNARFVAGKVEETLAEASGLELPSPDVVLIDPPRAGFGPRVAEELLDLGPERMVCVSCDAATLARDMASLAPDYTVRRIVPVDMFPHSRHVEMVALLEKI